MSKGTVLVSGASGYIASHVIKELLQRDYHVVGTVRSVAKKAKY
jgi:NADPH-dependent methylglyoxal reductase